MRKRIKRLSNISEKAWFTAKLEMNFLSFFRWSFYNSTGQKPLLGIHHYKIAEALQRVADGKIKKLIINVPPQYGKTLLAVINFIAWGFAKNPRCKFLHASTSADLALGNSKEAKDILQSSWYQSFWNRRVQVDSTAKSLWKLESGGVVRATSVGGQVMGFSAGLIKAKEFSGALIIDDPLKTSDIFSEVARNKVNANFTNVLKNRVADANTPIILIMQRLHPDDLTGYILENETKRYGWEVLKLPAVYDGKALWEDKFPLGALEDIKETSSTFYWQSQYMQDPVDMEGGMIKSQWFTQVDKEPMEGDYYLSCDTAIKTGKENDYSAIGVFKAKDNVACLEYMWRDKLEFPDLLAKLKQLANLYKPVKVLIEDKASGQQLIQDLRRHTSLPIVAVKVNNDKITRTAQATSHLETGRITLPRTPHIWKDDFLAEVASFPNGKNDDMVDALTQFVNYYCSNPIKTENDLFW